MKQLKKDQIWVYRNEDNMVDFILYVLDPSWSTTEAWCRIVHWKDDCQVEYLKDKKIGVVFYRKDYIIDDPHWELVDSSEAFQWICDLYAELYMIKQEKAVYEEEAQSKISEHQQIIKECIQASNAHIEAIESDRKLVSKLLNENKKLKDSISCTVDEQEGILVFFKDGSERLIKGGVRHAFDSINDMFYVMDKEDETIAGFESDFVRGFMPVNRRQQRCD